MNLPKNGRIVVVDNNPNEALPLIRSLAKSGHPVLFFSEKLEELPQQPIQGTRILFLDMVLVENTQDLQIIIGALKSVLGRILHSKNGPFLTIAWTRQPKYVEELQQYFNEKDFDSLITTLEKSECQLPGSEEFDIDLINSKIADVIRKHESLKLFTCWENIAHESAMTTVNQISNLNKFSDDWNDKMKSIIFEMAKAYAGKKLVQETPHEVIKNSLFSLSGVFTDNLHNSIQKDTDLEKIGLTFPSSEGQDDGLSIGKINSKLNLDLTRAKNTDMPGSIYTFRATQDIRPWELLVKQSDIGGLCKEKIQKMKLKMIVLEATPACDYAQNKQRVHRLVPGLLCPDECYKHIKRPTNFVYSSPIIEYEEKLYYLVFDFRFFTSVTKEEIGRFKYLFRMKQELLADFQSRLASHVSRLGIVALEK